MGLYNYHAERLPSPLRENKCFICDSAMTPYNRNPELDAFQYKCNNCNPKLIIEISGSMLASSLYTRLRDNSEARKKILNVIRSSSNESFAITTSFVSKYI